MSADARSAYARSAYAKLTARFARIATLGEASAVLGWDASPLRLSLRVAEARVDDVVRVLHEELCRL